MSRVNPELLRSALVAALGSFLFGFDTAVISGTTEALRLRFALTNNQLGLTVASALVGTILGSLAAGSPAERRGRRPVLRALAVLYLVSAAGCALAWDWWSLVGFRLIGGLAIGGSSVVAPLYIAEIAPAAVRGRLVGLSQFNVVAGILVAYLSNYFVAASVGGPESEAWRVMLAIPALPAAAFYLLLLGIPESPRWLVKRHRRDEALAVLRRLGNVEPEALVAEIAESLHEETVSADEPFFQRKYRKPILLALMVASFNQLSGINALIYYTADIFRMAGAERAGALQQSVVVGFTNLVFTMIAMSIIDRFGRRRLLLVGALGLAACLGLAAWAFAGNRGGAVVLGSLIGYIAFFAFSQGSVIWVYLSEIFPNRVRARGQALGSFTHWFWAALVSWTFPDDRRGLGRLRLRVLRGHDAAPVRARARVPARDEGRVAGADPAQAGDRVRKLWPLACAIGLLSATALLRADQDEPLRPQFHFSPARNFMNDPNGLVFFEGEYHLFYQHNPEGDRWGHMSWGHAVSTRPRPLAAPRRGAARGERRDDLLGQRGRGPRGRERALRTAGPAWWPSTRASRRNRQTQNIAASRDRGRTFTKYAGNPVLDLGRKDFRDPKVFWHAGDEALRHGRGPAGRAQGPLLRLARPEALGDAQRLRPRRGHGRRVGVSRPLPAPRGGRAGRDPLRPRRGHQPRRNRGRLGRTVLRRDLRRRRASPTTTRPRRRCGPITARTSTRACPSPTCPPRTAAASGWAG